MVKRDDVFRLLLEAGDFISGEALSDKLGVSRAAVWKHVKGLQNEGYTIEAVRKRGYRLLPNGVRQEEVLPYLQTEWLGREYKYLAEVDSTNIAAKSWAEQGAVNGAVVVADLQTHGSSLEQSQRHGPLVESGFAPPAGAGARAADFFNDGCCHLRRFAGIGLSGRH